MKNNIVKMTREAKISDSFWFYKVVEEESIAKSLIESLLDMRIKSIGKIEIESGIRFEVLRNGEETRYDIEIHKVNNVEEIGKQFRYYQDVRYLEDNEYYKKSYLIFLCDTDCFKKGFPIYTFQNRAIENTEIILGDETYRVILNSDYIEKNKNMVSDDIAELLKYLRTGKVKENSCDLVKNIQEKFGVIKLSVD